MQSQQCLECRHYLGEAMCAAFPEKIPEEIMTDEFDHIRPYPGDHGIQFEPQPGYDAQGRKLKSKPPTEQHREPSARAVFLLPGNVAHCKERNAIGVCWRQTIDGEGVRYA